MNLQKVWFALIIVGISAVLMTACSPKDPAEISSQADGSESSLSSLLSSADEVDPTVTSSQNNAEEGESTPDPSETASSGSASETTPVESSSPNNSKPSSVVSRPSGNSDTTTSHRQPVQNDDEEEDDEPGGVESSQSMTYGEYKSLSPVEQQAYYESFSDPEDFIAWLSLSVPPEVKKISCGSAFMQAAIFSRDSRKIFFSGRESL